jgi:hypothetical protein
MNGAVFKVSTRCHTETAAVAQLRRFEANPSAYRVAVSAAVLKAAKQLRAEGYLHLGRFAKAFERACIKAKVAPHTPGRYRHAVATWPSSAALTSAPSPRSSGTAHRPRPGASTQPTRPRRRCRRLSETEVPT